MSHSLILLRLLAAGKPLTVADMSMLSGLTMRQVMDAMAVLRKTKSMRALDLPYQITATGLSWLHVREARAVKLPRPTKKPKEPKRIGRPPLPVEVRDAREKARRQKLVADRKLIRQQERDRARELQEEIAERARIAAAAIDTVSQAKAHRTPLEVAWGGANA